MALEYTYYGAADLSTEDLRSLLAGSVGGAIEGDGTVASDGLRVFAWRESPGEEASAPRLFGFTHRVTARFRFSSSRRDLDGRNTALMIGAALAIFERTRADSVLLFNGEEAVMRTVSGDVIFDADRDEWPDFPEAAALTDGRRVEMLPQPLL